MPKRTDIKKILIIGAGPIIIGQACEFDYSGTQACKALKEEGFEVVLINSNPATIMTDPSFADKTYIEPISPEHVEKIIEKERPDALLPTMGGQTSLNVAVTLAKTGVLEKYSVELIGAKLDAIKVAEDRDLFKQLMAQLELATPRSGIATTLKEGHKLAEEIGFPLILRPAFTLGGYGGGIAYNLDEFDEILVRGLNASPVSQVLVEQSVLGWKEYEMEVMRDLNDNVVIICAIENLDPMGVHTGDSITIAPSQTLSDKEYQILRDASIKIIRGVGVETGGSNIQFAVNPANGDFIVIEMNPRVSRSSALASKATGFPIAKIAAKLAVGYTLDEILNDITQKTMASFEPSIDYVVTKIPRFAFEKFPTAEDSLGTQMKSVGETMAIGRTFKESFQKALRGLEIGAVGFLDPKLNLIKYNKEFFPEEELKEIERCNSSSPELKKYLTKAISKPSSKRIFSVFSALYYGFTVEELFSLTSIDPWYLTHLKQIVDTGKDLESIAHKEGFDAIKEKITADKLKKLKSQGFSDKQFAKLLKTKESEIREWREKLGIRPSFKTIDTCAGEFQSYTPYHYSSYDEEDEVSESNNKKIMILGGGPNRIGQGIEFDYCCVHASLALREAGFETIMVNNNPETVSTDYDTSDRLYFEPITTEDVLAVWNKEKPMGAIVQLGGQTPLNICRELEQNGVKIIGTSPQSIDLAEDRERFGEILRKLNLQQPANGTANTVQEAITIAEKIGYPVMLRPSYVLGGRGMGVVYSPEALEEWAQKIIVNEEQLPILIDKFLHRATEVDVDAICDGETTIIAGIMEHIEHAGIHSGDSACVFPPQNIPETTIKEIKDATYKLANALDVKGPMNIQFALKDGIPYILEVNPRASRTLPFISKATGIAWAQVASLVMAGISLKQQGIETEITPKQISVKEAVFSFNKFDVSDTFLGPEMRSTGEVMGISNQFPRAFAKSQLGAGLQIKSKGKVFISSNDEDKDLLIPVAKELTELGYEIVATSGTGKLLESHGVKVQMTKKVNEGRPSIIDLMKNSEIQLIINLPANKQSLEDNKLISQTALSQNIPAITTITGAEATVKSIRSLQESPVEVKAIQDYN